MSIAAMKQALYALTYIHAETSQEEDDLIEKAIAALRAAIEQAKDPVAWQATADKCQIQTVPAKGGLLPTAPPAPRQWQGLTDDEIDKLRHLYDGTAGWTIERFARAIEAKLKEKNK
jgi:hypothetical protein